MTVTVESKKSYHHGDLRAQLIEAVRQLVEERGADGFSVSEASRLAGVSTAAPYKHFKDKPEILRAVASEAIARLAAAMQAAVDAHSDVTPQTIADMGQAYVDFARSEPGAFRLVFGLTEGHEADPALMEQGRATFGIVISAVADNLGVAHDDPRAIQRAYLLHCFVHGHSFIVIDHKDEAVDVDVDEATMLYQVATAVLNAPDLPTHDTKAPI